MKIPDSHHTTSKAIVRWYESKPQEHRPHMGASIIGHDCERFIWNTFRWALKPTFPGRVLRLFDTGKREESRLVEELRGIGATVWETDPDTGDQWRVSACNGHFGGSLDGVAQGLPEAPKTPAVLEFKTHNHKSFTDLIAQKVQASKPQHYDQMTIYMGLMEIDRALYMAVNKDTDDVYSEWVHFDADRFSVLLEKAQRLIDMTEPPQRLSSDPAHWQCKYCTFHAVCHGDRAAEANCRTCCHATVAPNASWICESNGKTLSQPAQAAGCKHHLMIPALVPYAEPVDGGSNWVAYQHRESGRHFINGPAEVAGSTYGPSFASVELHHCPGELINDMAGLKETFPTAKVVSGSVTTTAFDDMPSDDLDKVATKAEHPARKAARGRAAATLKALEAMK